jgi:glycine/D-amino acid oxidase-like deaminating enzyme
MYPVPNPIESYWLSEPHKLRDVRSTPNLPSHCTIAIIGSGMAGITTAYHILSQDPSLEVVVLEARELCSGATARNGGHSKVKTATLASLALAEGPEAADEMQTYVEGVIQGLKRIVEDEDLDCEFELRRSFDVFTDEAESVRLKKIYDESRAAGRSWTKNTHFIDGQYVEQVTSVKGATSAVSVPCCSFWPYKFVTQLAARLLERHAGFNIQTNTPVIAVTEKDEVNTIRTARGDMKADTVIFATNAYTSGLLPSFKDVIVPVRGMATHLVPAKPIHPHLTNTYNLDFGPGKGVDYLNPRPDGGIVVGGAKWTFDSDRDSWFNNYDDSVPFPQEAEAYWEGYMQRTFHGWEDSQSKVDKTWVGIMGSTPDGWPHVGRVLGAENQWVLAGFNGGGMALIPTASEAVARAVVENVVFEDVCENMGVPAWFRTGVGTGNERMRERFEKS